MVYKINDSIIVIQAEAINPIQTGVVFWSHDRGTAKLRFKLQKDGANQNLPEGTTVPIRLVFESSTAQDGYGKHDYLATIEDRLNGIVSIVLEDNILGYQGRVDGSIYIDFPNEQSLDTAGRFSFAIKRSPIDDSTPELEGYYFNGFSQTIDKIEQMIAYAKTEIDTKTAETKKEFDTELESVKTSITEAENSLSTMNKDMTTLEGKITEADQHFVSKESVEKGPLIFKSTSITTEDWDDIKESGLYYCAASTGINAPYTGKLYGFLTVYNELAVIIQKYEFGPNVYMRTFAGNPATWGSWIKVATANEVVNLTEPQVIGGIKDFSETPTVKGKEVLVNSNPLPYEVWLGPGGEQTNVSNKARLKFGPDLMTIETKTGREMKPSPLSWNNDRWLASITRDCQLFFEGQCRIQPNSSSGAYAYLVAYRGANEGEDEIGFFGGRGSTTGGGVMNYKQSVPLSGVITFKAGDHFALSLEMADGKTMAFTKINHMHIMEIVS